MSILRLSHNCILETGNLSDFPDSQRKVSSQDYNMTTMVMMTMIVTNRIVTGAHIHEVMSSTEGYIFPYFILPGQTPKVL